MDRAILAIDLGEDRQVAALMDHEGRVLGRRVATGKAYQLSDLLGWAFGQALGHGFAGLVVACEPTGHRWRVVMELADAVGAGFCCVHPLRVHLAREQDDNTRDKTDHKDAVLIGKLVARLDCYLPERADARWARLRHLGARRDRLVTVVVAVGRQVMELLGCCWPAALSAAAKPDRCPTWWACLQVVSEQEADPGEVAGRISWGQFLAAAHARLSDFGGTNLSHVVAQRFYQALRDRAGVAAQRRGALERIGLLAAERARALTEQRLVQQRMLDLVTELGLADRLGSIPGISLLGAAVILAETGDLSRFSSARAVVKHAGLNPVENRSGTLRGLTTVSRRGRPTLRLAAYRAAWGALGHNAVLHDKYTRLTTREADRLSGGQARLAAAATLLRWLYAIVTSGQAWDAQIAAGLVRRRQAQPAAA